MSNLLYASKLRPGDSVEFMGLPHLAPLTVATVNTLTDGRVAVGYIERNGRGAVYRPNEIMRIRGEWRAA